MTELAALNVRITGDSGDLTAAVNSAKTQLGGLNTTITQTKANAAGMGGALSGLATRMQGAGGKIGGIAMQLQDMAVQASMGTSAMIILGQQGSQVASMFGPLGAAFGAVLAVAPLLAVAFMDNAKNASALTSAMDELTAATEAFRISAQAIRLGVDEREVLIIEELARATADLTAQEQRLAANRGSQAAVDEARALVTQLQAQLDLYRQRRTEEQAMKTAVETSKLVADKMAAVMRQISNTKISGPWETLVGAIQAAIDNAGEYARSSMQYSGRGGDPRQFGALAGQTGTFNVENFAVPGTATGGGAAVNPLQAELETLQQGLMTQEQLQIESYTRQQETLNNALQQRLISQQQHAALMEQVEKTHQLAMTKETNAGVQATLGHLGQLFQGSKKIGAAIALANSWLAFTEVLKDPSLPWFAKIPKAAAVLASGLNAVRNIKSASPGGSAGGGGAGAAVGGAVSSAPQTSTQVALQLVGGDMFSRDQVMRLINAINDATSDGARIILR
jgi:hypothetical protein